MDDQRRSGSFLRESIFCFLFFRQLVVVLGGVVVEGYKESPDKGSQNSQSGVGTEERSACVQEDPMEIPIEVSLLY